MATLVYLSLSGMAPFYLAIDCQLVSNKAAFFQLKDVCRQKDLQQLWTHMLRCCCRSEAVEQSDGSSETD